MRIPLTCLHALMAVLAGLLGGLAPAQAAPYPQKTITLYIPLAAGSAIDVGMRILAPELSRQLGGVAIVMENLPGAAGVIGAGRVATAAPDGRVLGAFNDSILTMVPNLQKDVPWDPIRDFSPISLVGTLDWGLVSTPSLGYKRADDVIRAAQAEAGRITYGSGGIGSPQHIAMALFAARNHLNMRHVPYKGATQAAVGIAAGEVNTGFVALATIKGLVDSGKLSLLGVASDAPLAAFPGVPTIASTGSPGYGFKAWFVIVGPPGMPAPLVRQINEAIRVSLKNPEIRAKLTGQGLNPEGSSPETLGRMTRESFAAYKKLIEDNHIQPD